MNGKFRGFLVQRLFIAASVFGAWLFPLTSSIHAAQKDLQKLTVGYTPIAGASLPFFIAVEEKIFQKYGYEISPVFMGGSPLINSAILAGEFPHRLYRRRRGDLEPAQRQRSDRHRIAVAGAHHRWLVKA